MVIENILLLNLNWSKCNEFGAMTSSAVTLPLEFAYILSELKNNNYNVSFIDLWALNKNLQEIRDEIKKSKLIVVCSSPAYLFWRDGVRGIEFVKQNLNSIREINPWAILVLIGPHATVLPETLFSKNLDFIIRGEPELVTADLIRSIEDELPYPCGICYRKNKHWATSDGVVEVADLNRLPGIRFDLINLELYSYPRIPYSRLGKEITGLYEASRGCLFECIFCWRQGFRNRYRQKGLERIKEELSLLKNKNVKYIYLIDEIFPMDTEWCFQVAHLMKEYGIAWGCQVRPEYIVNDAVVSMMISTGCRLAQIGLETTEPLQYKLAKKNKIIDLKHLNTNIEKLISHNIAIDLFLTFGLPGDSEKSHLAMVKQLSNFSLEKINLIANSAMPFPKTELWNMGIKEGKALRAWRDIKPFSGLIANQFKDKNHLEGNIIKSLAYLNLLKTIRVIRKLFNKTHKIFIKDILKLNFYMASYLFPDIGKIRRLAYNILKR